MSSGILGIGLTGLVDLHTSSMRGVKQGTTITIASAIANQRAELVATQEPDAAILPSCPPSLPIGCRSTVSTFAPTKPCTVQVSSPDVPLPTGVAPANSGEYRMDTVIGAHPDAVNHIGSLLVTVSVCWSDVAGNVHEFQTSRLLVPGS